MRRAPGPRLSRRATPDPPALLHEFGRAEIRTGYRNLALAEDRRSCLPLARDPCSARASRLNRLEVECGRLTAAARRILLAALLAFELNPEAAPAAIGRDHPGARLPGRTMAYVLGVAACEVSHPIAVFILMKAGDSLLQTVISYS